LTEGIEPVEKKEKIRRQHTVKSEGGPYGAVKSTFTGTDKKKLDTKTKASSLQERKTKHTLKEKKKTGELKESLL